MLTLLLCCMAFEGEPFMKGSFDDALQMAKKEEKLILVDVYTDWCGPCKLLDRTTWKDPNVRKFLKDKMVGIKINAEKGEGIALARKYRVRGYPCLLIINEKGEIVDRTMGYLPPAGFLSWVRNAVM